MSESHGKESRTVICDIPRLGPVAEVPRYGMLDVEHSGQGGFVLEEWFPARYDYIVYVMATTITIGIEPIRQSRGCHCYIVPALAVLLAQGLCQSPGWMYDEAPARQAWRRHRRSVWQVVREAAEINVCGLVSCL